MAELRIPDETAPPGGTALFFVQMTEPEPISSGQTKVRYARSTLNHKSVGAAHPVWLGSVGQLAVHPGADGPSAVAAPQDVFGAVSRVDVLAVTDEVSGSVSISDGTISIQIAAKTASFGTDRDLPLVAFAVPISPNAVPGQSFTVEIQVASLSGPGGTSYQVSTRTGTFTVGGAAISEVSPYRGLLAAGSVLTVNGTGFEPGVEVKIDETKVDAVDFVSPTQLRVHLGSNLDLRNTTRFRLRNPSGSSDLYYPINARPQALPSPGTISFLTASKSILADVVDGLDLQTELASAGDLEVLVSDPTILSVESGLRLQAGPARKTIRVLGRRTGQATVTARANGAEGTITVNVTKGSVFQVPVLRNTPELRMGLALTNRSAVTADVLLRGFPAANVGTQSIEVSVQMPPGRQVAQFLDEISAQFVDFSGWVEVSSPQPGVSVMFIHVPAGLVRYPGAVAETRGVRQFVLTCPESSGRYEIALANNNLAAAQVGFTWFSSTGVPLASQSRTIASQGALVEDIRGLLGNPVPALGDGYLEVQSSEELTGFFEMTDVPLFFGAGLSNPGEPGQILDLPRTAAGSGWDTFVDIANLSNSASTGSIRARLQSGDLLPAKEIALPPHGFARIKLSELPGITTGQLQGGSAQIQMSGRTGASALLLGPPGSGLATSLPIYHSPSSEYVFGQVANGSLGGFQLFTGLGVANPGADSSQVTVQVLDMNGILKGETVFNLAAGASRVELLSELIPALPAQFGGHVHISSSRPIMAVEIFGDSALSFLSAVPAWSAVP